MYKNLNFKPFLIGGVLLMLFCSVGNALEHFDAASLKANYYKAIDAYDAGNYIEAKVYLDSILTVKKRADKDSTPSYRKVYNFLGVINKKQGNLQSAINDYQQAIKHTRSEEHLPSCYNNLANIYTLRGNFIDSRSYLNKALSILNAQEIKDFELIAVIYHNLAYSLFQAGEYEGSLINYKESIRISKEELGRCDGETYYSCGSVYIELDSLDMALKCMEKSIKCNCTDYGANHHITAMSYLNYASFLVDNGEYVKSEQLYNKALFILRNSLGEKHLYTSYCYKFLGNLFYQKGGDMHKVLSLYQKALMSKIVGFDESTIYSNPPKTLFPDLEIADILKQKALAFEALAEVEDKEGNLKAALLTMELSIFYTEQLKRTYLHENEKLKISERRHENYLSIIRISYNLFELLKDVSYVEKAFKYSELNKYSISLELVNEELARSQSHVPERVLAKERAIKAQIVDFRISIDAENKIESLDCSKINEWNNKLFLLNQDYEELVGRLDRLTYNSNFLKKSGAVKIKDFKESLGRNDIAVEYVISGDQLYTFLISDEHLSFHKRKLDSQFYSALDYMIEFLNTTTFTDYDRYRSAAYELYLELIKPYEMELSGKNLLIIPDGKLSLIAFEALAEEQQGDPEAADYSHVPYLLHKYPMTYALSASLYTNTNGRNASLFPRFTGFAPNYKNSVDSLPHLPLTRFSLMKMAFFTLGDQFIGGRATKSNFKAFQNNTDIIHLYVHGFEDSLTPGLSCIYFHKETEMQDNEAELHAYELSNMDMNSNLVVLSACYSGSGKISKGEGVMSLGRSFLNAGCSSIIMSLWRSPYKSTISELEGFYKYLLLGRRKDVALQCAKLGYLKGADSYDAHPRNWAGLILVGNHDPLYKSYTIPLVILLYLTLFIFLFIAIRLMFKLLGKIVNVSSLRHN